MPSAAAVTTRSTRGSSAKAATTAGSDTERPRSRSRSRSRESRKSSGQAAGAVKQKIGTRGKSSTDLSGAAAGHSWHCWQHVELGDLVSSKALLTYAVFAARLVVLSYYLTLPRDLLYSWKTLTFDTIKQQLNAMIACRLTCAEVLLYCTFTVLRNTLLNFTGLTQLNVNFIMCAMLAARSTALYMLQSNSALLFVHPQRLLFLTTLHALLECTVKQILTRLASFDKERSAHFSQVRTRASLRSKSSALAAAAAADSSLNMCERALVHVINAYNKLFTMDAGDCEARAALLTMFVALNSFVMLNTNKAQPFKSFAWMIAAVNIAVQFIRSVKLSAMADDLHTVSSFMHSKFNETGKIHMNFATHLAYLMQYQVFDVFYSNLSLFYVLTSPYRVVPGLMQIMAFSTIAVCLILLYSSMPFPLSNINLSPNTRKAVRPRMSRLVGPSTLVQIALYALQALLTNETSVASLVHVDHILTHTFVDLFIIL